MQWADPGVKPAINSPIAPFGPALVPVLPRADRAVRTVSPAACTHVHAMCHAMSMSMYRVLLLSVPWAHGTPSNRCTEYAECQVVNYGCATIVL